jgi:Asp-tRNA(Asn)/Glu-tRNA(Gln) amidotransferase A subunit family amidase
VSGSSGGDGALVAARCVPFSIGTDIGGSIRGPAACNGIVGFKPTSQRSSQRGVVTPATGYSTPQTQVLSCGGPLCNSVDDVKRYCEALWSDNFYS